MNFGYIQQWIGRVMEEVEAGELLSVEITAQLDDTYYARIRGERYTLFDFNGDAIMAASGNTMNEALAKLDALCMKDIA